VPQPWGLFSDTLLPPATAGFTKAEKGLVKRLSEHERFAEGGPRITSTIQIPLDGSNTGQEAIIDEHL